MWPLSLREGGGGVSGRATIFFYFAASLTLHTKYYSDGSWHAYTLDLGIIALNPDTVYQAGLRIWFKKGL